MAEKMCYLEFEYQIWATRVYGWVQKDDIQLYYRSAIWNWHFFGGGGGSKDPFLPWNISTCPPFERCRFEPECHRRRIDTKENAKVIAAVWGTELIKLFAVLCGYSILPRGRNVKNRMNSSSSFKSFWCNSSYMIQIVQYKGNWINSFPPKQKRRPLSFLLSLSFFNAGGPCTASAVLVIYFYFPTPHLSVPSEDPV